MPPRRVHIDEIRGDAVFIVANSEPPSIPEGAGRECPQCKQTAWALSRWCWNCAFDFDRAAIPAIHPTKLLWVSLLVNAVIAFCSGWVAVSSYMTDR